MLIKGYPYFSMLQSAWVCRLPESRPSVGTCVVELQSAWVCRLPETSRYRYLSGSWLQSAWVCRLPVHQNGFIFPFQQLQSAWVCRLPVKIPYALLQTGSGCNLRGCVGCQIVALIGLCHTILLQSAWMCGLLNIKIKNYSNIF